VLQIQLCTCIKEPWQDYRRGITTVVTPSARLFVVHQVTYSAEALDTDQTPALSLINRLGN
jgi:hypothetical protein